MCGKGEEGVPGCPSSCRLRGDTRRIIVVLMYSLFVASFNRSHEHHDF
jgi:hypothetical protein